jgi:DNA-binding NarL/FixJ family response regulator
VTIRTLLIDDHPLVVDGLQSALGRNSAIEIVGTAGSLNGARETLDATSPDVVLLDLRLPDGSGTELLAEYQKRDDGPAFIVLSTYMTTQYVNAAIALGAAGFLLKTSPSEEIVAAIVEVAGGKLAYTADQLRASWRAGWTPLSARERDVIAGVMAGLSNDELSVQLSVSRKTVEAYLSRLFERFAVFTRTELAVLAEREQWLALPTQRAARDSGGRAR